MTAKRGRTIDHVVVAVRDLDRAAADYAALGFTLTPRAQHPWGTANRLAQLGNGNFIELLEVDRPELIPPHGDGRFSFGAFNSEFLRHDEGLAMLVLAGGDAQADAARFAAAGLTTYEPFDFERQAQLPDGSSVKVAFSLAFASDPALPRTGFFTCHSRFPQHFWKPEFQAHANGALEIERVLMVAEDPASHAPFLAGFSGGHAEAGGGGVEVSCGRHRIAVLTPAAAGRLGVDFDLSGGPRFIGVTIAATSPPADLTPPSLAHGMLIDWRKAG